MYRVCLAALLIIVAGCAEGQKPTPLPRAGATPLAVDKEGKPLHPLAKPDGSPK